MNIACDGQVGIKENKFACTGTPSFKRTTLEEVF